MNRKRKCYEIYIEDEDNIDKTIKRPTKFYDKNLKLKIYQ